jgi:hypothetical protein
MQGSPMMYATGRLHPWTVSLQKAWVLLRVTPTGE